MIDIQEKQGHFEIAVKVNPGAAQSKIVGALAGALKIMVTAPPQKGKANKEVLQILAKALNIAKKDCAIVQGETSSHKKVAVYHCSRKYLEEQLADILE